MDNTDIEVMRTLYEKAVDIAGSQIDSDIAFKLVQDIPTGERQIEVAFDDGCTVVLPTLENPTAETVAEAIVTAYKKTHGKEKAAELSFFGDKLEQLRDTDGLSSTDKMKALCAISKIADLLQDIGDIIARS